MAGRRTNLALLAALVAAFATGWAAYSAGTGWARGVLIAHAVAGLALLLLTPWKSLVARRGLKRRRAGWVASMLLGILVAASVITGGLHASGEVLTVGPLTAMQVHVGAAVAAIPLVFWHVLARRVRPRATDLSRRNLLRAGALAGGGGALWFVMEGIFRFGSLKGGHRRFTGSHETGSFDPGAMPVTQWLDDPVPRLEESSWQLAVSDAEGSRRWTYDDLSHFRDRLTATLDCTGGWFAEQEWEGVRLDRLVTSVEGARSVLVGSETGYFRRFPVADLSRLLLATRVGGAALSRGHGFPARLVAPGRRGFWWVKWVTSIEVSSRPWWWQSPFPLT